MLALIRGRGRFVLAALAIIGLIGLISHREQVSNQYAWLTGSPKHEDSRSVNLKAQSGGFEAIELPKQQEPIPEVRKGEGGIPQEVIENLPVEAMHEVQMTAAKLLPARALIITCPAWQLSLLPEVKHFVYDVAPKYAPKLTVQFKSHAIPTIEFFDESDNSMGAAEKLEPYSSDEIEKMLQEKGFTPE